MEQNDLLKHARSRRQALKLFGGATATGLLAAACTGGAVDNDAGGGDSGGGDQDSDGGEQGGSDATAPANSTADSVEVVQGETFDFQVQTGVPASSVYHGLVETWGERLNTMSGGRLNPDVVPSGGVVGALEILDAVDAEVVPVGMAWSNYWTGKSDSAALFSNPPAGSTGMDQSTSLAWMYDGGGLDLYARLYQEEIGVNVIPFPMMPMGPDPFGWFKTKITSTEDLQGIKFRSPPGLPGLTFDKVGLEAVAMPGSEIIPSAQSGIIDGAEWISPADDTALGFQDVWDNYYLQGIHQSTDIGELLINKDFFEGLPGDLQLMIRICTQATIVDSQNLSITQNAAAVTALKEQGINIWNTPEAFYQDFIDAWEEVASELEAGDAFFKEVRDSQRAYAQAVMPYRLTITELYQRIGETFYPDKVGENPA